jgi:hypothetical protein
VPAAEHYWTGNHKADGAREVVQIAVTRVTASHIYFTNPGLPWSGDGDLVGICAIGRKVGGRWELRKFDHVRASTRERDWKNIGNYNGTTKPASGEECVLVLSNYRGTERSNFATFRYP